MKHAIAAVIALTTLSGAALAQAEAAPKAEAAQPVLKHHAPAAGAVVIRPGHPDLDVSRVQPFVQDWRIAFPQEDGSVKYGITLHNTLERIEGGTLWMFRSEMSMGGTEIFYEVVCDATTLAAVRQRQPDPKGDIEVVFEHGRIFGTIQRPEDAEPQELSIPIDGPMFQSSLASMVFGCLPLEIGYAASIPSVDFHESETGWMSIEVTALEPVTVYEGLVADAYKVSVAQLGDTASVRWITTDPAQQARFEFGAGGGGYWQLIDPAELEAEAETAPEG
ncbi:MAG: hypothetical protein ACI89L_000339 [Phycisphaerales bacterium]|jgi:hypothetical protein